VVRRVRFSSSSLWDSYVSISWIWLIAGRVIHKSMVSYCKWWSLTDRIIVGVKYCFRYSQRGRRAQQQQFDEEVDMATLHPFVGMHHPVQRRRREKKLLKLDEVNERFPAMTYKAWRAQRERQGLSAEGGIANQAANGLPSVTSPPGSTPATPVRSSTPELEIVPLNDFEIASNSEKEPIPSPATPTLETPTTPIASSSKHRESTLSVEDDEDHHTPIPDELLATTGDNCAICIELLEDEDEVRGLTCGHCYHQTCLDPWLTQRRASCPLCKADYYIPKPPSTEPNDASATANGERSAPPAVMTEHWAPLFFRPFRPGMMPTSNSLPGSAYPYPTFSFFDRRSTAGATGNGSTAATARQNSRWGFGRRTQLHNPFRRGARTTSDVNALERGDGQTTQNANTGL